MFCRILDDRKEKLVDDLETILLRITKRDGYIRDMSQARVIWTQLQLREFDHFVLVTHFGHIMVDNLRAVSRVLCNDSQT